MSKLLTTLAVIGGIFAACGLIKVMKHQSNFSTNLDATNFKNWKVTHKKTYGSQEEENYRFGVYRANLKFINEHNSKNTELTLGATQFADLTPEEFAKTHLRTKANPAPQKAEALPLSDAPKALDWRKSGAVTSVKNQGMCGSCWAFSATGSMESAYYLKTKKLTDFSVQQIVDCDKSGQDEGCNGGFMTGAFSYVEKSGLEALKDYKYQGVDEKCAYDKTKTVSDFKLKSYSTVPKSDSDQLKQYLLKQPVSIGIDANILQFYLFGIVDWLPCSTQINHGVLLVGYDTSYLGTPYWIVKNSWGSFWGERGYFRIVRASGKGMGKCGITEQASVPNM